MLCGVYQLAIFSFFLNKKISLETVELQGGALLVVSAGKNNQILINSEARYL
jgi:hypothetical protein